MNAVQADIQNLIKVELNEANKVNPQFNSAHEGYAVILEESDEVNMEVVAMSDCLTELWRSVKANNNGKSTINVCLLRAAAVNLACEAVQVAAMCDKLLAFYAQGG